MADFTLPNLGEDIDEADVLRVLVSEGDTIAVDQAVLEIETEKATLDVPSSVAGTVAKIHVGPGDVITVGQVILTLEEGDGAGAAGSEPEAEEEPETEAEPEPEAAEAAPGDAAEPEEDEEEKPEPEQPAAEDDAGEEEEEVAEAEPAPEPQQPAATTPPPPTSPGATPIFAAPSVRRFAREIGVDIAEVRGSGPGGRISEEDVKRHARARAEKPPAAPPAAEAQPRRELPDFSQWGEVTREPLSRLRRTVARNMAQSWEDIPHVHIYHHADITAMEELRQQYRERAREAGGNLTISVMMLKIVAAALRAHPLMNSSLDLDSGELIVKKYIHLGVAVDTERGLVVPKIEDVDQKNIIDISIELNEIAQRARENKLTVEEMRGSTFTVSNLGSLGTGHFDAIVNWPEVAVLGLGRAEQVPVWDEERENWEPRLRMPLSLGFDHRVVDGADAARFMSWIVEAIKNPLLMALEG
jgi:pyruvate dehydrogenase E2 component (dihydrolipoamide acetyltransferase)